jgi:hypothetical protein
MQTQPLMLPEGDFAVGMRAVAGDSGRSSAHGDFASGMRSGPPALAIGTFATGQATKPGSFIRGYFATGQSSRSPHVRIPHPRMHRHEHGQPAVGAPATEAGLS